MMNDETLIKYVGIPLLLFMAFIGSVLPQVFLSSAVAENHTSFWLAVGNSCAAGVFFAAGMLHMLAEAIETLSDRDLGAGTHHYPLAIFLCCVGFLITFFFERVVIRGHDAIVASLDLNKVEDDGHHHHHHDHDGDHYDDLDHNGDVNVHDPLVVKVDACCDDDDDTTDDAVSMSDGYTSGDALLTSVKKQVSRYNGVALTDSPRLRSSTLPSAVHNYLKESRTSKVRIKYYSRLFESGLKTGLVVANELQRQEIADVSNVHVHSTDQVQESTNPLPYIVLSVLSLHAFITGIALGTTSDFSNSAMLLAVLMLHKFSAAGSLSIVFLKNEIPTKMAYKLLSFFAVTTPLGLGLGILLDHFGMSSELFSGICMSVASGTFVYVSVMSIMVDEFVESNSHLYKKFAALFFGFSVMCAVALVA